MKHGKREVEGCWKGPKKISFEMMKGTKKDVMLIFE